MASNFNHFPQAYEAIHDALRQAVKKATISAGKNVQAVIAANGQIETGYMYDSVYTQTNDVRFTTNFRSTYKSAPKALPEVAKPGDDVTGHVAVAAEYAAFPNYGTVKQPARPFFEPAIELTKSEFESDLGNLEITVKGLMPPPPP